MNKQPNQKMGRRSKQTFLQRRYTDGQKVHGKMLNITMREMQIKTTKRQWITLYWSEQPSLNKSINNIQWREHGEKGLLHCWWEQKLVQPLWRTPWRLHRKLNIELPYDPAILLLGIYLEKIIIQTDIYIPVFTETLFIIVNTWKQPKCYQQKSG